MISFASKSVQRSLHLLQAPSTYRFAQNKEDIDRRKDVKIDPKYLLKSAALYDRYLQSRQKPMISLDDYVINYCWVLQRMPIFLPYRKQYFQFYKNRYQMVKKTGYQCNIPKQLTIEDGDYLFEEYEKSNPENIPSHQSFINNQTTYYREHARYWKFADPDMKDEKSVQNHASDSVFFIVQNDKGQWIFPERSIAQKQSHDQFFKNFSKELFAGPAYPNLYFHDQKPNYVTKTEIQNLQKGKGIKTFYFKGFSMSGITKFPTGGFKDYRWVPKPHLHKYFTEEYAKKTIALAKFPF